MEKPIDLKKLNVVIGRNNSSKSALLQALYLFPFPYSVPPFSSGNQQKFAWLTNQFGGSPTPNSAMLYRYADQAKMEYFTDKGVVTFLFDSNSRAMTVEGQQVQMTEPAIAQRLFPENPTDAIEQVPAYTSWLADAQVSTLTQPDFWRTIERSDAHYTIATDFISRCVNEKFTELTVRYNELYLRREPKTSKPFYVKFTDMGDGVRRFAATLLLASSSTPQLALWDDFDAHMHPSMISIVLEYLAKQKWKVVVSTHSIDSLSKLVDLDPADAQVILLNKNSEDQVNHKVLSVENVQDLLESNQDPRKLAEIFSV